jgi:exopolysaccharide biosynthesis polyprenyl glycosylphosphotransferase
MPKISLSRVLLALGDAVILVLTFLLAVNIRFAFSFIESTSLLDAFPGFLWLLCMYVFVWIGIFQNFNLYKIHVFLSVIEQFVSIIKAMGYGLIGLIVMSFFVKDSRVYESRLTFGIFAPLSTLCIIIYRIGFFRTLYLSLSRRSIGLRNILIIGAGQQGKDIAVEIQRGFQYGLNVTGFIDDTVPVGRSVLEKVPVLGTIASVEQVITDNKIDEVIIAINNITYERLHDIIDHCKPMTTSLKLSSRLYEIVPAKVPIDFYGNHGVIDISASGLDAVHKTYKRVIDVFVSSVILTLASPILLVVCLLIRLDSPGPIFYRQRRVGKDEELFWCYKLRSMYIDADARRQELEKLNEASGPIFKIKNDPRITRIGRFIRKYSIDELPQLWNVLTGDMSLVGPRPGTPDELQRYENWHKRRLRVPQGITGLWQVSGRSNLSFNEMVVLDIYYVENRSVLMDINIILKTIPAILFSKGAY